MQKAFVRLAFLAGAIVLYASSGAAAAQYTVTELPVPSGYTNCNVSRSNDALQIAGTCYNSAGWQAVLWQNGSVIILPDLPGFAKSTSDSVGPKGQVVGWAEGTNGLDAMLWANGSVLDLGRLPGTSTSMAADINAAGTIVGFSDNHAVEWAQGQILDFGGYLNMKPSSINASGHFVGFGVIAPGDVGGSIIDAGRPGSPLRYLAQSAFGEASTINDREVVVGYDQASSSSARIPWQWHLRSFTPLPFLAATTSCTPTGINDNGSTVGACGASAVLWRRSGVVDLNSLIPRNTGWHLVVATTINRRGEIVGDGYFGGQFQAFVLEPDPRTVAY